MIYALLCDPGPGDALRFFHALCEMALEKKEAVSLFCLKIGYKKTYRLLNNMMPFNDQFYYGYDYCIRSDTMNVYIAENIQVLNKQLQDYTHGEVYYCFETQYFQDGKKELDLSIIKGVDADFILLDRYKNYHYMRNNIHDHLILKSTPKTKDWWGLLFVRLNDIKPERNMSKELFKGILKIGKKVGIRWMVAGSFLTKEYSTILDSYKENKFLYTDTYYPDYYQQLLDFSCFHMAIGMNSGALDLAAAAGLPLIRIAEYHQSIPYQGIHYNDYLCGGKTVNILSNSERDISNIRIQTIYTAMDLLQYGKKEIIYY